MAKGEGRREGSMMEFPGPFSFQHFQKDPRLSLE